MKKAIKVSILSALALVIALVIGLLAFGIIWLRGMGVPAWYSPKDYDPLLTKQAHKAFPVMIALDKQMKTKGEYPLDLEDAKIPITDGVFYRNLDRTSYEIYVKLGWDASLMYDSASKGWEFDPGDGSEPREIRIR